MAKGSMEKEGSVEKDHGGTVFVPLKCDVYNERLKGPWHAFLTTRPLVWFRRRRQCAHYAEKEETKTPHNLLFFSLSLQGD